MTKDNHLIRYGLETGKFIQEICLSKRSKFTKLHWETYCERFYVANAGKRDNIECILFSVEPFRLVAKFVVQKQFFGDCRSNIHSVSFFMGFLVIFQRCHFYFYNLQQIINEVSDCSYDLIGSSFVCSMKQK